MNLKGLLNTALVSVLLVITEATSSFDISFFHPMTFLTDSGRNVDPATVSDITGVSTAYAAIEHVKSRNGEVIPELATLTCDVPINITFLDSMNDFTSTLQQYFHSNSINGQPDAVIGPQRSSSSIPLSFVSNVDGAPMMGFSATSAELDNKASHPNFFRTIPSDAATTFALAKMFEQFEYPRITVMYIEESYGQNYKDGLVIACALSGIEVDIFPFTSQDQPSILNSLVEIKETKLNVVVLVAFEEDIEYIMSEASRLGLTGEGKLWVFSDSINSLDTVESITTGNIDIAKAFNGTIQMRATARIEGSETLARFESMYSNLSLYSEIQAVLPGGDASVDVFDDFNFTDLASEYPNFWQDTSPDEFSIFIYDAVLAIAFALERNCTGFKQIGKQALIDSLKDPSFSFEGVTGTVRFDPETFSRSVEAANFGFFSFILNEAGDTARLVQTGTYDSSTATWDISPNIFYPPGTSTVLPSFTDAPEEEQNLASRGITIAAYVISGLVMVVIGFLMMATYRYRKLPIITAAQPRYLYLIGLGLIMVCVSTVLFAADETQFQVEALSSFCNSSQWLLSLGITLTTFGFTMKLYKIVIVFENAAKYAQTEARTFPIMFLSLDVTLVVISLSIWTVFGDVGYERTVLERDEFDQALESKGSCTSPGPLFIPIVLVHLCQYGIASYLSFRARNISDDFQEGKWISMALFSQIQLALLSLPVLLTVEDQSTNIIVLTRTSLFGFITLTIALTLWLPKLVRVWNGNSSVSMEKAISGLRRKSKSEEGRVTYPNKFGQGNSETPTDSL